VPDFKIDTEKVFKEVVRTVGGRCLDDELKGKADFQNADFLFEKHNCVGELKRIQKFLDEDPIFRKKLGNLYSAWVRENRVPPPPFGTRFIEFNLLDIPKDCAEQFMSLLRKQLMSAYLEKANRQLRETKKRFKIQNAYGIVFLAIEGTAWYAPQGLMTVLARIPKNRLDAVDAFIVFNSNYAARHPSLGEPVAYWACTRYSVRQKPEALTDALADQWGLKLSEIQPGPVTTYYPHYSELGRIQFPETS